MKNILLASPIVALTVSCSTLEQSLKFGAATGALTGAAASYAGQSTSGKKPTIEDAGIGASIGLGLGLITSYLIHEQVILDRDEAIRQPQIYFGDLPPSPFIVPTPKPKKGGR